MNLTAITDKEEVYLKHFYDSITAAFYFDFTEAIKLFVMLVRSGISKYSTKICFPAFACNNCRFITKTNYFFKSFSKELELENVHFIMIEQKHLGKKQIREQYDIVTARAVARISVLSEFCLPLVKEGGIYCYERCSCQ